MIKAEIDRVSNELSQTDGVMRRQQLVKRLWKLQRQLENEGQQEVTVPIPKVKRAGPPHEPTT